MRKPIFKNIPNKYISDDYWKSRCTSVQGFIFALMPEKINSEQMHILIIKRSENMDTEPNKFGVPCGYLDWNETLYEAMLREIYEETSLYIPDYDDYIIFDNNKQPFFVDSNPNSIYNKRQNIEHNYVIVLDFSAASIDQFPKHIENYTSNETSLVKWMSWHDFSINELEWSFGHNRRIGDAMVYYMEGFANNEWYYKQII
jgi:ADP-ribose pyrophosphatase YjhB (NUDIX family)